MSSWLDEVEARVNAVVDDFLPVHTILLLQVGVKATLNVLDDGFPAVRKRG